MAKVFLERRLVGIVGEAAHKDFARKRRSTSVELYRVRIPADSLCASCARALGDHAELSGTLGRSDLLPVDCSITETCTRSA